MTENLSKYTKKIKVVAIVGPTASGKTSFAVQYAKEHNGEIVSADSRLVYKGFDIATAKPAKEEKQGIVHHLIDIVEPEYDYSVAQYVKDAEKSILDIISRHKLPVITGGTGLYLKSLLEGYDFPEMEPDYALRQELYKLKTDELYNELQKRDCATAEKVDKNDKKKIIRSLEVINSSKKPLSEIKRLKEPIYNVEWIGLNYPRQELYERINKRVDFMIKKGLIDETKFLLQKHGNISNIINTIGYHEITEYLNGVMTLEEAVAKLKQNTRNYAKRQLTWFRKNNAIKWNYYPEKFKK